MDNEEWLPTQFAGYEVSSLGRIRSLKGSAPRALYQHRGKHYLTVSLSVNGKVTTQYVHQLVAVAFLGPRPAGLVTCHGAAGKQENAVVNLRYDRQSNDNRDTLRDGTNFEANRLYCDHNHELTQENTQLEKSRLGVDGVQLWRRRCRECLKAKSARDYLVRKTRGSAQRAV